MDKVHPLRNASLDIWWSGHHCCVSCCRATQKLVSANFRSLSEEENKPNQTRLLWFAAAYKSSESSVCYLAAAGSVSLGSESVCRVAGGPVLCSGFAVGVDGGLATAGPTGPCPASGGTLHWAQSQRGRRELSSPALLSVLGQLK